VFIREAIREPLLLLHLYEFLLDIDVTLFGPLGKKKFSRDFLILGENLGFQRKILVSHRNNWLQLAIGSFGNILLENLNGKFFLEYSFLNIFFLEYSF
jgi:hypothetical protein